MFEEYHENAEDAVLTTIQVAPAAKTSNVKTYDKHSMAMRFSTNEEWSLSKAEYSPSGQRRQYIDSSNGLYSNIMKTEWIKMLTLAGNTIIFQLRSQTKRSFMAADEDDKNLDLNIYLRLRIARLFDLVELNFSLRQYPGTPSIQVSLRAQTRVKRLPLHSFFMDIYGRRSRGNQLLQGKKAPSKEEQLRLASIARKLLLQSLYARDAAPNYIDAQGQTLLHVGP